MVKPVSWVCWDSDYLFSIAKATAVLSLFSVRCFKKSQFFYQSNCDCLQVVVSSLPVFLAWWLTDLEEKHISERAWINKKNRRRKEREREEGRREGGKGRWGEQALAAKQQLPGRAKHSGWRYSGWHGHGKHKHGSGRPCPSPHSLCLAKYY